jgi:hypothetical protein
MRWTSAGDARTAASHSGEKVRSVNDVALVILLLAGVGAIGWFVVAKPSAVFVVRIRDGEPQIARGKTTGAFLAAVADVCRDLDLGAGEIRGVSRGRRIALWFSSDVPHEARQRLRNWWAESGWKALPRRG